MARKNEITKSNAMVTKAVKMPLAVTVTAMPADHKHGIAGDLMDRLVAKLPIKIRLGRGRKETITIGLK